MTPDQLDIIKGYADIGSSAGILVIVFLYLRDMARSVKGLSDSVIKMEARGDVISPPAPRLVRGCSEHG